jgi:hypothetical protein
MNKEDKAKLTTILFAQTVAGSRNVKPMKRLEALYNDIGTVINGDQPKASWSLTKTPNL